MECKLESPYVFSDATLELIDTLWNVNQGAGAEVLGGEQN